MSNQVSSEVGLSPNFRVDPVEPVESAPPVLIIDAPTPEHEPSRRNFTSGIQLTFDKIRASVMEPKRETKEEIAVRNPSFFDTFKCDQEMQEKVILHSISGRCRAGRLTAIMGSSGAGKTSLLNVLAATASSDMTISGDISINDKIVKSETIKKLSAFVHQDDVILSTQTVTEAITMSSMLRLPRVMPLEEKQKRVADMIVSLHLTDCKDTEIGDPALGVTGVSGGERKRTSIGMELVTNPSLLFLDEPTSGLDSFTAYTVVRTLHDLAQNNGKTIVMTIHQPSSEIFHLFDDLLLLARGEVIYLGPAEGLVPYLATQGFVCPLYTNPSDYLFMEVLNQQVLMPPADSLEAPKTSEETMNIHRDLKKVAEERVTRLIDNWKSIKTEEISASSEILEATTQRPVFFFFPLTSC
eukprot:gnl/Spiro4/13139_TR6966_c4_g4_i2.p1 gnl/Spiro4/13139_TR6966_c4_g4~~gnl/Spiro4/13139_TR6966_c4_g4_i2.p1  ORF type:complete len:427 (+),score=90.07 gnl/Spiro4/13139_TR6966_c4_g4_i2:46-1281(+)